VVLYTAIFQITGTMERMARKVAGQGYIVYMPEIFHADLLQGTVLLANEEGAAKGAMKRLK
jgi:carboxymethylenebutenolidase